MEQFQGPGACLVVERIIREGTDDASQEKGQSCLFVLERYRERSSPIGNSSSGGGRGVRLRSLTTETSECQEFSCEDCQEQASV